VSPVRQIVFRLVADTPIPPLRHCGPEPRPRFLVKPGLCHARHPRHACASLPSKDVLIKDGRRITPDIMTRLLWPLKLRPNGLKHPDDERKDYTVHCRNLEIGRIYKLTVRTQ
jgi:hypothetical protein